jgi:NADH-quinone oxidoreductase subunit C
VSTGPGDDGAEAVEQSAADQARSTDALPNPPVPAQAPAEPEGPAVIEVRHGMFGVADDGDTSGYNRLVRTVTLPGDSPRPYGPGDGHGMFDEIADELDAALAARGTELAATAIEKTVVYRGQITFFVRREHLVEVARTLRDEPGLRFELCLGVTGAHFPQETGRELHSVLILRSLTHGGMIRLETTAPDADPHLPSLVSVYPAVDWHEREAYDMFGIVYDGHPALTRILMPDDWHGHPQRKDYPLGGIPVEFKGAQIPAPDQRRAYN